MKLSQILLGLLSVVGLPAQEVQIPAPPDAAMVIKSVEAVFPADLKARGVTAGRARIAVSVGGTGMPMDTIVESDTDPALGQAAREAVRQWIFNRPAITAEDGPQVLNIELSFGDPATAALIPWTYRTPVLNQLDRIPNPTNVVRPDPEKQTGFAVLSGRHNLTVAYYIDETGRVRLPAVVVGVNPNYNRMALDAVAQWKFDPPLIQGKPTAVRSQQTFRFGPKGQLLPDVVIKPPVRIAEYVMPGPLYGASAVTDGKAIYIVSGKGSPIAPILSQILRFDLQTHEFTKLAENKIVPRLFGGAALANGKIYMIGGNGLVHNTWQHTQLYDLATGELSKGPVMGLPRAHFALGVTHNRIYIAGGGIEGLEPERSSEYLDLDTNVWKSAPAMPLRGYVAGAVPPNGRLVVAGGETWGWGSSARNRRWSVFQAAVRVYLPEQNRWFMRPRLAWPIDTSTAQVVNWQLYLFGNYNEVEIYDLQSAVSQAFALPTAGGYAASSVVVGDCIYLIGGTLDPRRGLSSRMLQVYQTQR